ncbi:MAG TPA: GNAT family N-acetyltransferase [Candidatus Limnocylindria bacterium]|nr:GNAT family N-acetyltransferase [Candidatus Limnocylindria bacterium]
MDIDVRAFSGDPRGFYDAAEMAFGEWPRDADFDRWKQTFEADRAIAAYDGDAVVGTAGIFTFDMTVPGGVLPAAGVTIVGVQPTHRRRGVLRRMMRLQLDAIHERGEPIAVLWASEGNIYQRFGYGLASLKAAVNVARDRSAFRQPLTPAGSVRFVDLEEAKRRFPPVFDAIRLGRVGFWTRSPEFWTTEFFADPEHWRQGASAAFHVVHEVAGDADGYARYRIRDDWKDGTPKSTVDIVEVLATNPSAYLDLWRYLLDIDLMGQASAWNLAVDDPLLLTIAEPRRLQMTVGDALWLRVVDVASALAGRRYRIDGSVVLEVADEFCEWNDGRWALRVEDGVPFIGPTTEPADLRCDVSDLGATYLGAFSFAELADAGRVQELQPGGLLRTDALFRTDRAPWCPRVF